jgi:hypothetical protein
MHAFQPQLPLALAQRPRQRSVRRPFHPSQGEGKYRLPHGVRDRLASSLTPFRNRDSAMTLAVFIARYHSAPGRVVEAFYLDRRALIDHPDLGLSERQIRSAIRVLEEIAFLKRAIVPSGSKYKATENGLHRKPIKFEFGSEYGPLFEAANKRAAAARGGDAHARRPITAETMRPRPATSPEGSRAKCPKDISAAYRYVNLGHVRTGEKIPVPPKSLEQSHISRKMRSPEGPAAPLSEGEGKMDRPSQRSSVENRRSPKNEPEVITTHLDENEQKANTARFNKTFAQTVAARRAADAQDGKASDLGSSPIRRADPAHGRPRGSRRAIGWDRGPRTRGSPSQLERLEDRADQAAIRRREEAGLRHLDEV